jgi:prepilin-type N-terminal cleavage/methylation domain-containing protein
MLTSPSQIESCSGFSFIEILITLALLSGSYLLIFSSQQFVTASIVRQERELKELLEASNRHELEMALTYSEED